MGFDMKILQCRKFDLERALNKYCKVDINELPYEAIENLESEAHSRLFTSRIHILDSMEDKLPYAHDTYVFLSKNHYNSIISYCEQKKKVLYPEMLKNIKVREYGECVRMLEFLNDLKIDWNNEVLLYEYDC